LAHTYTPITRSDRTYTPVSDVTPIVGSVEEQLTWVFIEALWETWSWLELLTKEHWCDWYYGVTYVDSWSSLTIPSYIYSEVTK